MSWADEAMHNANKEISERIERATITYQMFSPIVMRLLTELGESLFSKDGFWGKKRYYTVACPEKIYQGSFEWRFDTDDRVISTLWISIRIDELRSEKEKINNPDLHNKSLLFVVSDYDTWSWGPVRTYPHGDIIDTEERLLSYLKDVVSEYIKRRPSDPSLWLK